MSDRGITLQLEIPPEVTQQGVWELEEQCKQVTGVTTDLQESKDPIAVTLLFIFVAGQAVAIAEGINTIHDLAQNIYTFLHPKKPVSEQQQGKNKVVIITKKRRIELYNLSLQEIEKIIEQ